MNRKAIGSIVAVVLAAIGTFVLLAYVKAADDRALAGERVVPVLVVKEAVAAGTQASDLGNRVAVERVPVKVLAEGGVSDLAKLEGQVAAVDLVPGEQVVAARFQSPSEAMAAGAVKIPEGLQEVTIPLSAERAVGGALSPGDTVGIAASFTAKSTGEDGEAKADAVETTHLIFHKVLVTNVQGVAAAGDDAAAQPSATAGQQVLVTLAVEANDAEKLIFTAEFGSLWLTAEPASAAEEPTQIESRGTIYE